MKDIVLKEYGSWIVVSISYLIGMLSGGKTDTKSFAAFIAIAAFVNSKQAISRWLRNPGASSYLLLFIAQVLCGSLILFSVSGMDILRLMPYLLIPLSYIALLRYKGEHFVLTEIAGFASLTLAVVIARFVNTGIIDNVLYISVMLFFIAGGLRVRLQLRKRVAERVIMIVYVFLAAAIFDLIRMPVIILLPLVENIVYALILYKVRLRVTGWIEALKGLAFFLMMIYIN
jgi:hypothetical protein